MHISSSSEGDRTYRYYLAEKLPDVLTDVGTDRGENECLPLNELHYEILSHLTLGQLSVLVLGSLELKETGSQGFFKHHLLIVILSHVYLVVHLAVQYHTVTLAFTLALLFCAALCLTTTVTLMVLYEHWRILITIKIYVLLFLTT